MSKEYLDRKEVEEIIKSSFIFDECDEGQLVMVINQICQLQPKNQVVIAEGEYHGMSICENEEAHLSGEGQPIENIMDAELSDYPKGTRFQIIIKITKK